MKVAIIRRLSKLEGDLKADGYELKPVIVSTAVTGGKDKLIITIQLKQGDIKRILDYWSCVRTLTRR